MSQAVFDPGKVTVNIADYGQVTAQFPAGWSLDVQEQATDLIAQVVADVMMLIAPTAKSFHPALGMRRNIS